MKTSFVSLLCAAAFLAFSAQAKVTREATQSFPLSFSGVISVKNMNGEVTITTWDKNEVTLETLTTGKEQADLDRTRVVAEVKDDVLTIATELDKGGLLGSVQSSVRYRLQVPAGVSLKAIRTTNGGINVSGVRGSVELFTTNGGITAKGLASDAILTTTNGSISAEVASVAAMRSLSIKTTNGGVVLTLPKDASAKLQARTTNGDISVAQPLTQAEKTRRFVRGQIGEGGPSVELGTTNGRVVVK